MLIKGKGLWQTDDGHLKRSVIIALGTEVKVMCSLKKMAYDKQTMDT